MSEYYFSEKPLTPFTKEYFTITILGHDIKINSGSGIFSLKELDKGSKLLIENTKILKENAEVLDLGCGYGIIGIAIKKNYPNINLTMIDINERAIRLAKQNIKENNIEADIIKSNIYTNPQLTNKKFDLILTNPPFSAGKKVCQEFIQQSVNHINKEGLLLLVAPHNKGGSSLKNTMLDVFGNAGELAKKSGYRVYISIKK